MSTSTSLSTVYKDGKKTTTKTVTTTGKDGKNTTKTFIEENEDGKADQKNSVFFKKRIKDFRGDYETDKNDNFGGNNNKMSTSTSSSTVYKDGKMITTKIVTTTDIDGKPTTETFVEELEEDKTGQTSSDFFKMRMKEFKEDDQEKDKIDDFKGNKEDVSDESKSSTEDDSDDQYTKFQLECVKSHNTYRAIHGVTNLQLSKKLCNYAQEWAEKLMDENLFQHRPDHKYGENIYSSWSSESKAKIRGGDAVDSWYKEIEQHNFGEETRSMKTGHFTQVVWAASTRLGVGLARKEGKVVVVANYDPPGNYRGKYGENVPPPV